MQKKIYLLHFGAVINFYVQILSIMRKKQLTPDQQVKLFSRPDAQTAVLNYIEEGNPLCKEAQLKLFILKDPETPLTFYLEKEWQLCEEAFLKLFDLPRPHLLVELYIAQGGTVPDKAQMKLFELTSAKIVIKRYFKGDWRICGRPCPEFCEKARQKGWLTKQQYKFFTATD